jgi:hypothetical protein
MNTAEIIYHYVEKFSEPVQSEVLDFVLFLQQKSNVGVEHFTVHERRTKLREAMIFLQQSNAFKEIENPEKWQREIRADRHLPGREF